MGLEAVGAIALVLTTVAGIFGFMFKMERGKVDDLRKENGNLTRENKTATTQAKLAEARARMHREAARTVMKHHDIAEAKIEKIKERIDNAKEGETFTVTT